MITLTQATQQLAPYLRNEEEATSKINLAQERILAFGKWKGLVQPLELTVYEDSQVTLPPDFETALAFSREGKSRQPRDQWFSFYRGTVNPDYGIHPADLGDYYCTFRPIAGAVALKFELGFRGADNVDFVIALTQANGDPLLDGQKFYITETLHDGRQVYKNAAGSLHIWGTITDSAIYISETIGDISGPYWKTATGPFSQLLFLPFQPFNGAAGATVWAEMIVPTESAPLNPLAGDDGAVDVSIGIRRTTDQGIRADEESYSGPLRDYTERFARGELQEITSLVKGRTQGVVTLLAQFPEDEGDWTPVGFFSERDTDIRLRRYMVPGATVGSSVLALCKKRYRPAESPGDILSIGSIYSLRLAMEALSYEDSGDLEKAANFWALCKKSLDDALSEHRNASGRTLPIYVRAAAGAGLKAIR